MFALAANLLFLVWVFMKLPNSYVDVVACFVYGQTAYFLWMPQKRSRTNLRKAAKSGKDGQWWTDRGHTHQLAPLTRQKGIVSFWGCSHTHFAALRKLVWGRFWGIHKKWAILPTTIMEQTLLILECLRTFEAIFLLYDKFQIIFHMITWFSDKCK